MTLSDPLSSPRPQFSIADSVQLAKKYFGLNVEAKVLTSERDQNFRLADDSGSKYVLKISNLAESADVVDLQNAALTHIERVSPQLPVPRVLPNLSGQLVTTQQQNTQSYHLRLVSFLAGRPMQRYTRDTRLLAQLGQMQARLGHALRGLFHPAAGRNLLWDLAKAETLTTKIQYIDDRAARSQVEQVFDRYCASTQPRLRSLRAQLIHNDCNPDNILMDPGASQVTGIIDFGDLVHAPLICDLAIAAAYQLDNSSQPLAGAAVLVQAYHQQVSLEAAELELLAELIMTRIATTITISSWRAKQHPDNRQYIMTSFEQACRSLHTLSQHSPDEITAVLMPTSKAANPQSVSSSFAEPSGESEVVADADEQINEALLAERDRVLGPVYRLFYDHPLHFVSGRGVWLYDRAGRAYLDVYNNVASVGHCHERVVAALSTQAARLNTHTRYLHTTVVQYAKRLTALTPIEDPVCMFCCTGSEANELAYRIAMAYTNARGVVVSEHAYHGNSAATAQFSTADTPPQRRESYVVTVPSPDQYRGNKQHAGQLEHYHKDSIDKALSSLANNGSGVAAMLVDTIFSCPGIVTPPPGYLADAASRVRAAGGLFIADEVQAGFARTGEAFWGFERHGIVPDIITMGKPMAAGHPVAAVITSKKIVAAFAREVDYFNTFGGNPVSSAIGMAVLDVIEDENLQANALQTGAYLKQQLGQLQSMHDIIGDIRGAGLFVGVELVTDRHALSPASTEAKTVVNKLAQGEVLIGATGPNGNVLKLRPPLIFNRNNADQLVEALDQALQFTDQ